ncbi:hypothetical protein GCM10029964_077140 [Kibdelosporangium lantanae]
MFGNVSADDVRLTVESLPMFLRTGATVVWTRGRFADDDDFPEVVRGWFGENGFTELGFDTAPGTRYGVGANRLAVPPKPYRPDVQLFRFTR